MPAVVAPALGDSATVLTTRGIAAGRGHYCVRGRQRSSERESGVKRNLGVWAPAAHRGDCSRGSSRVRDNHVRERSRCLRLREWISASPSARREGGKGVEGGVSATQVAVK